LTAARSSARLKELGWFYWRIRLNVLRIVLIKTRNAPAIPTMKIRRRFFELNSVENKMQLESESSSRK